MDKRTFVALVLMALVIVITPMFLPSAPRPTAPPADSGRPAEPSAPTPEATPTVAAITPPVAAPPTPKPVAPGRPTATVAAETVVVNTPLAKYILQSVGATPLSVQLNAY